MIRKIFFATIATFALSSAGSQAQNPNFSDGRQDLFFCDFQTLEESYNSFTTYNLQDAEPSSFMVNVGFKADRPWLFKLMDEITSYNCYAGTFSEFATPNRANSWLVAKPVYIPTKGCKLSWKSESFNPQKLDGLKVFVSEVGGNPETDFPENPVWETEAEPAGNSEMLDGEWNDHVISLDQYAGKTIWIAFVNQSYDGQILCIDDVRVFYDGPFIVDKASHTQFVDQDEFTMQGVITSRSAEITEYTAYYQMNGGEIYSQKYTGLNIKPGDSHTFTFDQKAIATEKGKYVPYKMWVEVAGLESAGVNDSVARVNFIPRRRVVIEEGTGAWCGWCPQGILALERLQEIYGDQVIPIAVHYNDAMQVPNYISEFNFPGYPVGVANRSQMCYPMMSTDEGYTFEGVGTFDYAVKEELKSEPYGELRIGKAEMQDGKITINTEIEFAMVPKVKDFRAAFVVMENDVVMFDVYQSNNLAGYTLPIFGEFASGGKYGQSRLLKFPFQEVARTIFPSFAGGTGILPSDLEADLKYYAELNMPMTDVTVLDSTKLELVVMLLDGVTGKIITADKKKITYTGEGETAIGEIEADTNRNTPFHVYDVLGRKVRHNATNLSGLPSGIYVVNGRKVIK